MNNNLRATAANKANCTQDNSDSEGYQKSIREDDSEDREVDLDNKDVVDPSSSRHYEWRLPPYNVPGSNLHFTNMKRCVC